MARSRARRFLVAFFGHGWRSVVLGATFVVSLPVGLSLHAQLPAVRRLGATITNSVLDGPFAGKIVVTDIQSLSVGPRSSVRVKDARIIHPDGKDVIHAKDVQGEIDLAALLRSLIAGDAPNVHLTYARIGEGEVFVDQDEAGQIRIAQTFASRPKPPSILPPPPPSTPKEESVVLQIDEARIQHAKAHGNVVKPSLEATAEDVHATLGIHKNVFSLKLLGGKATLDQPRIPHQTAPIKGDATGELTVALKVAKPYGNAKLVGDIGGIPVIAVASIDEDRKIDATVTIARTDAAVVTKVFPDVPLAQPIELKLTAKGALPTVILHADTTIGTSVAKIDGELDLRQGLAFTADVDLTHVDARAFGGTAPTDLTGKVHVDGVLAESPSGRFKVVSDEGSAAGQRVPPAVIEGSFDTKGATATFRATETGLVASGKVSVSAPDKTVTFDLQARSDALRTLARAPNIVSSGSASARAQGTIDIEKKTITAKVTANADNIAKDTISARHATVSGQVSGPLAAPLLDVNVDADDVKLTAKGKEPLVYPKTKGHAKVALFPTPHIIDATLNVGEEGKPGAVVAKSEGIRIANGVIEARKIRIDGLGAPLELDAKLQGDNWHVRAKSTGVDLHRAAAVSGVAELKLFPEGTRASIDVDLSSEPQENGHLDVVIVGKGVRIEAHAKRKKEKLVATAKATLEGTGEVEVTNAELEIPGRIDARSLKRVTGVAELRGWVDLAQVGNMFGGDIESMTGRATYEARIERGSPTTMPDVRVTAQTHELAIAFFGEKDAPGLTIAGIDGSFHAHWDGMTDDTEVAFVTWDRKGVLATGNAKAHLPVLDFATGKATLDAAAIARLEIDAVVDVPSRNAEDFPKVLGLRDLSGTIAGRVQTSGPLARPTARLVTTVAGLRSARHGRPGALGGPQTGGPGQGPPATYEPLDGEIRAQFDGEEVVTSIQIDERATRRRPRPRGDGREEVVDVQEAALPARNRKPGHVRGLVIGKIRAADLIEGKRVAGALPWNASAELDVTDLEIAPFPTPVRLSGAMTGRFSVKDLNGEGSLHGRATIAGFGVGQAVLEKLDLTVGARHNSLFASLISKDEKGTANVTLASRALIWRGVDIDWNAKEPTRIDYDIQNLRLAILQPLIKNSVPELTGRVDGKGSASVDATSQVFEGGLNVTKARLYVTAIGEEMTDVSASMKFDKTGIFRIDDATAKVGAGEVRASATGRMNGLRFVGANATIVVPSKEGVPISSEGATFASATGEMKVGVALDAKNAFAVTVDIPRAGFDLPDKGTQALQSLDPDETIAIGIRRADGKLDERGFRREQRAAKTEDAPANPTTARLTVTLGDQVSIEGRGLQVSLAGRTVVDIAEEVRVTGRIDLRGGTVEVHGRRFKVDRGSITFGEGGDPGNPTILAAAYWDSPDRTRVWVEFTGPLKTGKITLRSEPPYSKNEILSVLLFGRPDPNQAASGEKSSAGGGATAVGSGFVAGDINRMLAELDENLDVETDTLSGNRTRTKVGYGLFDRRLKVQLAYAPGRTYREPDSTFLLLNWQFVPKWSLVGTRGDRGTTILDVIFQHRY